MRFNAVNSKGNIQERYFWDFGDGTTDQYISKPKHRYNKTGKFNARLIVQSVDSCSDTAYTKITVMSPNTDFKFGPNICSGDSHLIINLANPDTMVQWYEWRINDTLITKDSNFHTQFSIPKHLIDTNKLSNRNSFKLRWDLAFPVGLPWKELKRTTSKVSPLVCY